MEVTNTTHTKRNKKDTNAKRAFKHIIGGIATSNYLSVDKDAKTNIKRNRYKYKYNKKKQKCKEDMEAHYYWWEPAASFSLSLNPPNNCQPSTQYALSLSLMMVAAKYDNIKEILTRIILQIQIMLQMEIQNESTLSLSPMSEAKVQRRSKNYIFIWLRFCIAFAW